MSHRDDASGSQLLSLDVGGTVYTASRQTFSAVPDSWFAKVLSGDVTLPRTAQDVRFVDRDAQVCAAPNGLRVLQHAPRRAVHPFCNTMPHVNRIAYRDERSLPFWVVLLCRPGASAACSGRAQARARACARARARYSRSHCYYMPACATGGALVAVRAAHAFRSRELCALFS